MKGCLVGYLLRLPALAIARKEKGFVTGALDIPRMQNRARIYRTL